MMTWDYTPNYRNFDTFFGYYGGGIYYFDHYGKDHYYKGYDMRLNTLNYNRENEYSMTIWSNYTQTLINDLADSDSEQPFFMYIVPDLL